MVPAAKGGSSLKLKSTLFQLLADKSSYGILIFRGEKVFYVNKQLSKISGYTLKQLRAWSIQDFISMINEEDRGKALEVYGDLVGGKSVSYHYQFRFPHKKKGMRWVDGTGILVKVDEEAFLQVRLIDITDHKQLEITVEESEAKYRSFVENFHGIAYRAIIGGVVEFFHGDVEEITGYHEEDFVSGRVLWDKLIHPDDWGRIEANWERIGSEPGAFSDREYRIIRKDGAIRWIRDFVRNICDASGKPANVEGVLYDITERKRMEEAFHSLVEYSLQGLVIIQGDRIVFTNTAFAETLGYTVEEILAWSPKQVRAYVHPDDQSLVWGRFEARLKGEHPPNNYEFRVVCKDKSVRWLEVFAQPIEYQEKPAVQASYIDITERKLAEEAQRESEAKYRSLMEQTQEGIVIGQTPPPRLIFANPAMRTILGYTPEELTTMPPEALLTLIHPDDRDMFFGRFVDRITGKPAPSRYEVRGIRKDGTVRWIEVFSRRIQYEGQPAAHATFVDITEQKLAEKALQVSEAKYRAVIDQMQEGLIIFQDERVVFANPAIEKITGYTVEEILALPSTMLWEGIYLEDREKVMRYFQDRFAGKEVPSHYTIRMIRKDESVYWAELSVQVIEYLGKPAIQASYIDVSDRREAELAAKESEKRYRDLFDHVPIGLYITSPDGQIIDANPALVEVLGHKDRESLLARKASEFYVNPEVRQQWLDLMTHEGVVRDFEAQFQLPDGRLIWIVNNARAILDNSGKVLYNEGSMEDITERKIAQEGLAASEAKFRALVEETSDWVVELDSEGRVTYSNNAIEGALGITAGQILGRSIFEFMVEEAGPPAKAAYSQYVLKGKPFENLVYRFTHRTGQMIILEGGGRPVFDEQHRVTGFRGIFRNITERVEAASVIRESEEKYRYLVEQSLQGLAIIQGDPPRIVFANPAFAEMLGYAPDQLIAFSAESVRRIIPAEDYPMLIERFGELISGAPSFPRIIRMVRKDEDIRLVQVFGHRIEYEGQPALQLYGIDATEHKEVETEYRTLVEATPDAIILTDLQGIILMVNEQTVQFYGYTREELIGMNSFNLVVKEEQQRAAGELQRLLQGKSVSAVEFKALRKDGTMVAIELNATPIMDPDGTPRAFLTIGRDISEREATFAIIREREEQYRLLYENTVAGIFLVDNQGEIMMCNAYGAELFGYKPSELAGTKFESLLHPEDKERILQRFQEGIEQGRTLVSGIEGIGLRKDGSTFHYHVTSTALGKDGMVDGFQSVILDITSIKETQAELQAEQDRIEFLNDLMVHDLINVNQGILSVLELQLREPTLPEGFRELVELALSQVTRSTALIARMRRLSRIKTEIPQFEKRDIAVTLHSAVESLEEVIPDKTLQLETNVEAGKYIVLADSLLYDLFYNLIYRALKIDEQKQVRVNLMVGPAKSKGFLQILYKDYVPTSSAEEGVHLVGRVTGDTAALDLGISLTLVERIVMRYGGKVWVQDPTPDSPAEGTILIILLPKPN